jgi:hypothetical protein
MPLQRLSDGAVEFEAMNGGEYVVAFSPALTVD